MKMKYLTALVIGLCVMPSVFSATDPSVTEAVPSATASSTVLAGVAGSANVATSASGAGASAQMAVTLSALEGSPAGQAILDTPVSAGGSLTVQGVGGETVVISNKAGSSASVKTLLKD
ncbi:MAG: hypothetical protein NTZ67_05390 [Gammaproteobacteria bacterium]|nr:hypothetical protein [Gammaproteobacteria bacterium]